MSERKVIRVSEESEEILRQYAESKSTEEKSMSVGEAADRLIATAVSRLNALTRYAANKKPQPPGKPKKKKAEKKAKTKKAKKAKAAPAPETLNGASHEETADATA